MTARSFVTAIVVLSTAGVLAQARPAKPGANWPSYRGPNGAGVADGHALPAAWDVPARKGVKWTLAVEGLGHSSPMIWGNQLCVTTAISGKADNSLRIGQYGDIASVEDTTTHVWKLICADKTTGKQMFERTMHTGVPKIKRHTKSTHANTTLATDGAYMVAMLGSEGLYVYDMKGTLIWKKDLGVLDSGFYMVPEAQWEFSSSPVLHEGVVIIQADVQKDSFLAAFDVKTGKEIWRAPRTDVPTFGTPTIHRVGGQTQIIVNGWRHMGAYDFKTGKEIWKINGGGDIPVPVPVIGDGLIYITNAHGQASPIYAIRDTATGDISLKPGETTSAGIVWTAPREGAYLITPVLYDGVLYVCKTGGILSAFDAKTGERLYQQRLGKGVAAFTSSLVAGDGKVYVSSEEGDVYVIKAGRTFELLATNPLGELMLSTPAISEGVMYFRTNKQIVAIGN
ncbi:MAG TPA: PQQ-binding-like beta-propeller repeat protein [Vicinamibacterales bacterium]|nr:PQQ-binding-like beta-propeller repeat protein [Vicinamibacterales bacterium]